MNFPHGNGYFDYTETKSKLDTSTENFINMPDDLNTNDNYENDVHDDINDQPVQNMNSHHSNNCFEFINKEEEQIWKTTVKNSNNDDE